MSKQKPLIVFYMHKLPYPPENGTNQRIYAMAIYLKKEYEIGLVIPEYNKEVDQLYHIFDYIWYGGNYQKNLGRWRKIIFNYWYLFLLKKEFKKHLSKYRHNPFGRFNIQAVNTLYKVCLSKKPSLIIIQKVFNTVLSTAIASKFNIPTILDTHDLYTLQGYNHVKHQFKDAIVEDEKGLLEIADSLLAIQNQEAEVLKRYFPDKKIIVALHPAKVVSNKGNSHLFNENPVLLFVGSAAEHNIKSLQYFIEFHWQTVIRECPSTHLFICGPVCDYISLNYPNIVKLGIVKDIDDIYQQSTIVINPVLQGAGLKIKTIDALAYGKCLVTTPIGAEGLCNIEKALVCIEPEKFGYTIIQLLNNRQMVQAYEKAAQAYVEQHLTPESCFAQLSDLIRHLIK